MEYLLNTTKKGNEFESYVFSFIKNYIVEGNYSVNPNKCNFYQQKGYYSHKRKKDIKVDISVEVHAQNSDNLSLLLVFECKNYGHTVGVDDIEEFDSKLDQIAGRNVKGIVITTKAFSSGAIQFASSQGIALAKLQPLNKIEWILERTSKPLGTKNREIAEKSEIFIALTKADYISQSEVFFGTFSEVYSSNFSTILDNIIPYEYKSPIEQNLHSNETPHQLVPFIGKSEINKRTKNIFNYFKNDLFSGSSVDLDPICNYFTKEKSIEFIFNEHLGYSSTGEEILGKLSLNVKRVYISNSLEVNSPRWRYTLAHELGHLLLHKKLLIALPNFNLADNSETLLWSSVKGNDNQRLEWQANYFASSLLLPYDKVAPVLIKAIEECDVRNFNHGVLYLDNQPTNLYTYQRVISKLKKTFNVSKQAIHYRLAELKLLNNQLTEKSIRDVGSNLKF